MALTNDKKVIKEEEKTPEAIAREEAMKKAMAVWEQAVAERATEHGDGFTSKEFTFSQVERRRMFEQDTIRRLAIEAINDLLNLEVLPRVGITPREEVKILYDISVGRFAVWVPKEAKESTEKVVEETKAEEQSNG